MQLTSVYVLSAAIAAFSLAGCAPESPYESPKAAFLVPVLTVDSGVINLTNGTFDIGGEEGSGGVIPGEGQLPRVFIPNGTELRSAEQTYDLDDDNDLDYTVITIRALSAQAALSINAFKGETPVPIEQFIKIGGASIQPHDLQSTEPLEITLPVHPLNNDTTLELYKLREVDRDSIDGGLGTGGRQTSGLPSVVGHWIYVGDLTTNEDGTVTFEVGGDEDEEGDLGQFAVVSQQIPSGSGS